MESLVYIKLRGGLISIWKNGLKITLGQVKVMSDEFQRNSIKIIRVPERGKPQRNKNR